MAATLGFGKRRLIGEIVKNTWGVENPNDIRFGLKDILYIIQEMEDEEGKSHLTEKKNMRGHEIFKRFTEHMLYRNLANYDSMLLLTSEKGTGKSSAAIMIARQWCKLLGIRFDPTRHLAYSNKDVMDKIDMLNNFEPLVADESVRFACLSGDTIISTPKGDKKIKDLEGQKMFYVCSYNTKLGRIENSIAKKCIKTKTDYVYEIETECGKKIKATKEHKFLTNTGWKRLDELKEGDDLVDI